ncbi:MAG: superoxide dismutase [Firmicutes bacterium]|nr:superoxide dismutase [Bacillota bacterium]
MTNHYPFELVPLPYAYGALMPYIDEKTMHLHHDRHLLTYVTNLNAALKDYPELHDWSLERLLYYSDKLPSEIKTAVINNGGGVFNHNLYFWGMGTSKQKTQDQSSLMQAINQKYGNFDSFKKQFKAQALSVFGSGNTWLALDLDGGLQIANTKNQDTVLPLDLMPIFLIDVWEHAYYLKHYNLRADYIDDWFDVVDLEKADKNYCRIMILLNAAKK